MRTKRSFLSLLLCGAMLFSLCSPSAYAEAQTQDSGLIAADANSLCYPPEPPEDNGYSEEAPCSNDSESCPAPEDKPNSEKELGKNECICLSLCSGENINRDCPVCAAEDADLALCEGNAETATSSNDGDAETVSSSNDEDSETASLSSDGDSETVSSSNDGDSETASSSSDGDSETATSSNDGDSETATSSNDGDSETASSSSDGDSETVSSSNDGDSEATSNEEDAVTVADIQSMIDALPDAKEIAEDNAEEVSARLEAIDSAKAQLSDAETGLLDITRYTEAAAALSTLDTPVPAADPLQPLPAEGLVITEDTVDDQVATYQAGNGTADLAYNSDTQTVSVTLQDAQINGQLKITAAKAKWNVLLIVKGTNSITYNTYNAAAAILLSGCDLTVKGDSKDASLNIASYKQCIFAGTKYISGSGYVGGAISVENVSLALANKSLDAISSTNGNITISGSTLTGENISRAFIGFSETGKADIKILNESRIEGTAKECTLRWGKDILIDNSRISTEVRNTSCISAWGTLTIQNDSHIKAGTESSSDYTLGAVSDVQISGSTVEITSKRDALKSQNGNIGISDSNVSTTGTVSSICNANTGITISDCSVLTGTCSNAALQTDSGDITISGSGTKVDITSTGNSGISASSGNVVIQGAADISLKSKLCAIQTPNGSVSISDSGTKVDSSSAEEFGIYTTGGNVSIQNNAIVFIRSKRTAIQSTSDAGQNDSDYGNVVISGSQVTVTSETGHGIYATGKLTISDKANLFGEGYASIYVMKDIAVSDSTVNYTCTDNDGKAANNSGMTADGKVTIRESDVTAIGRKTGINGNRGIQVQRSTVFASSKESYAIATVLGELSISGSIVTASSEQAVGIYAYSMGILDGASFSVQCAPGAHPIRLLGQNAPIVSDDSVFTISEAEDKDSILVHDTDYYLITLDPQNGETAKQMILLQDGAFPELNLRKDNYQFDGWSESASGGTVLDKIPARHTTLYAKWLSSDTGVTEVTVDGVPGTVGGTEISVELPHNAIPPTDKEKVRLTVADGAAFSEPATTDSGATWTFTVTAEDNSTTQTYTIKVSVNGMHTFETWKSNEEMHWKECVCGEKEGEVPHNAPDDGNCLTAVTCTICGYETKTAETEHSFTDYVPNNDATCTKDGTETAMCGHDGCTVTDTRNDSGSKLPHDYSIVMTPPTCTDKGYTTHTCLDCGDSYVDAYIDANGHDFGDWIIISSPACTANGQKQRTCKVCGFTETENVDASGHEWEEDFTIDKAATCTEDGSRSIHCRNCDAVKDSEIIPKTDHTYTGWEKDEIQHWTICTVCKAEAWRGNHAYDGNKDTECNICGHVRIAVFTITFDSQGGSVSPDTAETADGKLRVLPVPVRSGFTFDGWFTQANGGEKVTADTAFTADATIYAHWSHAGGDNPSTPTYVSNTLSKDGVTLSGSNIHKDASLTVTADRLHEDEDCGYCGQIRQWQKQKRVIAIYDVSLSQGFLGTATLTFPVSDKYNGKTLTIVHCLKDRLDACEAVVSDGKLTITVSSLSPFAILDNSEPGKDNHNPNTGTLVSGTNAENPVASTENPGTATGSPLTDIKSPQTGDDGAADATDAGSTEGASDLAETAYSQKLKEDVAIPLTGANGRLSLWKAVVLFSLCAALIAGTMAAIYRRKRKTKTEIPE